MNQNKTFFVNSYYVIVFAIALSVLEFILISFHLPIIDTGDAGTYIDAIDVLLSGNIDGLRTPVYPMFLAIIRFLSPEWAFLQAVVCVQFLIFLISVIFFDKAARFFLKNDKIASIVTLFYAILPTNLIFVRAIFTESLSVSLLVSMLWAFLKAIDGGYKYQCLHIVLLLLLLFLRPAFIGLIPIFALYWGCRSWRSRSLQIGLVGVFLALFCYLGYCSMYKSKYGVFSTSYVGVLNRYYIEREINIIEYSDLQPDNTVVEFPYMGAEESVPYYAEFFYLLESGQLPRVADAVDRSLKNNKCKYLKKVAQNFNSVLYSFSYNYYSENRVLNCLQKLVNVPVLFVMLLLVSCGIFWMRNALLYKMADSETMVFWLIALSVFVTSFLGAQSDWKRLLLPSYPFVGLLAGWLCGQVFVWSSESKVA